MQGSGHVLRCREVPPAAAVRVTGVLYCESGPRLCGMRAMQHASRHRQGLPSRVHEATAVYFSLT